MTNPLFQKFVRFTTAVHEMTHDMTKGLPLDAVTPVQYKILEYIYVSEPVTLSQISECTGMSMPNTSRELKKLTEKQLCEKAAGGADRRKQDIRLSPRGHDLMNQVFRVIEARFAERTRSLTTAERTEVEHALEVLMKKVFAGG
ncbi:MarR family winged helix-turn-helix transcriptional regulator [Gorillibacterium sp. sgz5001074]|uniref:MarR family winged helix-turn-helix transcriptional regulator n=1 Tax=Gorillibacterium sp. sgz5001074 TaxID=3446695 RepID=UPI003F6674EF